MANNEQAVGGVATPTLNIPVIGLSGPVGSGKTNSVAFTLTQIELSEGLTPDDTTCDCGELYEDCCTPNCKSGRLR